MTARDKATIKTYFETGDKPNQSQFQDLIDSYVDEAGPIGILEAACSGLGSGPVVVSAGIPSIGTYVGIRNNMGVVVYTTAQTTQVVDSLIATTAQAVSGLDNSTLMTPLLVVQSIAANPPSPVTATNSQLGVVKPDASTITISSGTISAANQTTLGSPWTSTSGTSNTWLISGTTKRIVISFKGVNLSGSDQFLVQLGTGGSATSSGYTSTSGTVSVGSITSSSGFVIRAASSSAAFTGQIILNLVDSSSNLWVATHSGVIAGPGFNLGSGYVSLSGVIDRVVVLATGSNTFSAGEINIQYQ